MMTIVVKGWDYDEPDKKKERERERGMREASERASAGAAKCVLIASVESRSVPRRRAGEGGREGQKMKS